MNIKNYRIEMHGKYIKQLKEYNIYKEFNKNCLYEGMIYRKDSYKNITKTIKEDKIKIIGFIGENGNIYEEDLKKIAKFT